MALPTTMRAVDISTPGGPEVLQEVIRPTPQVGSEDVLIKVVGSGVNRPDCLQRLGKYPVPPDADPLPGLEVSGTVVETGSNVSQWQVGDKVCALTHGGGYAEYAAAHASHCLPVPEGLDLAHAAAIPETFFTVYYNVFTRAGLQEGETLLVHGGSSGIGSTAIQMAKVWGAQVITTAGSDEKCAFCERLGAARAINYRTEDFVAETKLFTQGKGVDVVLDMVAGPYVAKNIEVMARDGRYSLIAFLMGPKAEVNLGPLMRNRLTLTGSTLRPQSVEEKAAIASNLGRDFWPMLEAGNLAPIIFKEFPLAEAASAHELMESSQHMGKILLRV